MIYPIYLGYEVQNPTLSKNIVQEFAKKIAVLLIKSNNMALVTHHTIHVYHTSTVQYSVVLVLYNIVLEIYVNVPAK